MRQGSMRRKVARATAIAVLGVLLAGPALADFVINDDLIDIGSTCVGLDCVNGESFGFDTLRLKENNLRIKFQDTSNSASFPTNDWQITANSSANGGASFLSFDDIDNSRVPFTVRAGARNNALFVGSNNRIGYGTATPELDQHVVTGNTPAMRLDQDGSSGFAPQTWDLAGNEANFFIRDVTGGSRLPFRIRPGAPTSAIDIAGDGDIGVNTGDPRAKLHVNAGGSSTDSNNVRSKMIVQSNDLATAMSIRSLPTGGGDGELTFQVAPTAAFMGTHTSQRLDLRTGNQTRIRIGTDGKVGIGLDYSATMHPLEMASGAHVTDAGVWTNASDRGLKTDFSDVDRRKILETLAGVPIGSWRYKSEDPRTRHIGPIAQDFYAAFGLGHTDTAIGTLDADGVALVSIQALYDLVRELQARTDALESLGARVAALERKAAVAPVAAP